MGKNKYITSFCYLFTPEFLCSFFDIVKNYSFDTQTNLAFTRNLADKGGQVWHSGWHENQLLFDLSGGEKMEKMRKERT